MEATTKLYLFGSPQLTQNNEEKTINRRQAMALLAFLALEPGPHGRDTIAKMLWPNTSLDKARVSLRSILPLLKKQLEAQTLLTDRKIVALHEQHGLWLDVARFQAALAQIQAHHPEPSGLLCASCIDLLQTAVALYKAPFMDGFTLTDCPDYERWQTYWRQLLASQFSDGMTRLIQTLLNQGDKEQALTQVRQWILIDKYNETAHRQLMQLYHEMGQRPLALKHYLTLQETLATELNLAPEPETTTLYEAIRGLPQEQKPALPPHNLPVQLTRFLGRETEISEITERLDKTHCRLLTISGPGGIGKSRLAIEVGQMLLPLFTDGVYFVPLAPLERPERIVPAIATALNFRFYGNEENQQQLLNYLREKEMLLILDNFEHVTAAAPFLIEILKTATRVKLLITSRENLGLQAEWLYEIDGLPYPQNGAEHIDDNFTAVQLFSERATQAYNKFAITSENKLCIYQMCRFVEGTPLALELLAPLVRTHPCQHIAHNLQQDIDLLATTMQDVPFRHRSLRAVFEQSWRLLSEKERIVLKKLSIFRGGFSVLSAEFVADATQDLLEQLANKSLIKQLSLERFEMHELIKQYAFEYLDPIERKVVQDLHSQYFTEFLAARTNALQSGEVVSTLYEVGQEMENVRAAWNWSVSQEQETKIEELMEPLHQFYRTRGWLSEGCEIFSTAVTQLANTDTELTNLPLTRQQLVGRLLAHQAWFCWNSGQFSLAETLSNQALTLIDLVDDKKYLAFIFMIQGAVALFAHNDKHQSHLLFRRSYELYQEMKLQREMAVSLTNLGISHNQIGDYESAKQLLLEAVSICLQNNYRDQYARCLLNLGVIHEVTDQYQEAIEAYKSCFDVCHQLQNKLGMNISLINQSEVALRMGNYQEAKSLCQQQLQLSHEIGDRPHQVGGLAALGNTYYMLGNYSAAWQTLKEGLTIAVEIKSRPNIALALAQISRLLYHLGKAEASYTLLTIIHPYITHNTHHQGNPENLYEILTDELPENQREAIQSAWQSSELEEGIAFVYREFDTLLGPSA